MVSLETINDRLQYMEKQAAGGEEFKRKNISQQIKQTRFKLKDNKHDNEYDETHKKDIEKNTESGYEKEYVEYEKEYDKEYEENLQHNLAEVNKWQNNGLTVNLEDIIGPAFYDMHCDIREGRHSYYDCTGGRGSLKSSTISIEIVLGMMNDFDANAVVYRKVADTISQSVYEQILWAIDMLGVSKDWHCTKSPYTATYVPFGTKIVFKGLDKAGKSKSIKFSHGYAKYLWFEEFDEYTGPEEIRSVQQSVLRGGDKFFIFRSMNPPKSKSNWANEQIELDKQRPDVYVSETTYLQAPKDWLGQQFIDDAEWLKETKPDAYRHEYLGEPIGTGADVFDNIVSKRLIDAEVNTFANIYMGVDWGWFPDPFRWVKMNYDANRKILTIFDEYSCNKQTNQQTFDYLKDNKGVLPTDLITCDSAEPKSVSDYKLWGFNAREAVKGPRSVENGIKWLQQLTAIEIDPIRCPHTYNEFYHYELELDKEGNPIDGAFPDANNHSIDATRYAMERISKRRGN